MPCWVFSLRVDPNNTISIALYQIQILLQCWHLYMFHVIEEYYALARCIVTWLSQLTEHLSVLDKHDEQPQVPTNDSHVSRLHGVLSRDSDCIVLHVHINTNFQLYTKDHMCICFWLEGQHLYTIEVIRERAHLLG